MPDDDDIDHLYEAKQHVIATPFNPQDHFARAQAHALIAIGQELRNMNNLYRYRNGRPR